MSLYRRLVRPVLFRTDPEWAHDRSIRFAELASRSELTCRAVARRYVVHDERLALKLAGLAFRSPLGLAAGYDKNGRAVPLLSAFGFGHVEVGSVSAQRSAGNPAPRLFRLPRDNAIVVHYGVPNDGAVRVAERLAAVRRTVPVGINLVNTNRGPAAPVEPDEAVIADYVESVRLLQDRADYLCLNLSCPNTNDGSGFFPDPRRLSTLLEALDEVGIGKPVFLKVAPFATVGAPGSLPGGRRPGQLRVGLLGQPAAGPAARDAYPGRRTCGAARRGVGYAGRGGGEPDHPRAVPANGSRSIRDHRLRWRVHRRGRLPQDPAGRLAGPAADLVDLPGPGGGAVHPPAVTSAAGTRRLRPCPRCDRHRRYGLRDER